MTGLSFHEATWPSCNPLLMRLVTGVPVRHCGVAARAISRAMVVFDPSFGYCYYSCITLVDNDGKLSNCEGRLVVQFARYFPYIQLHLYLAYFSPGFLLTCLY